MGRGDATPSRVCGASQASARQLTSRFGGVKLADFAPLAGLAQANFTTKERNRLEDAFGAFELKTDPDSEEHGFVEHQDIPQLVRALGFALSNEVRAPAQRPLSPCSLVNPL